MVLGDTLKKVLLAGVGTVAATAEKGRELIDDMAKKGEITVEQSSILKKDIPENIQNLTSTIRNKVSKVTSTDFNAIIDKLGLDELGSLKETIEKKIADLKEQEEAVPEAETVPVEEAEEAVAEAEETVAETEEAVEAVAEEAAEPEE